MGGTKFWINYWEVITMKMKKLLVGTVAAMSLAAPALGSTSVFAKTTATAKTNTTMSYYRKAGAVLRLHKNIYPTKIYVGTSAYKKMAKGSTTVKAKTISAKKLQHVRFEVAKVVNPPKGYQGGPNYLVTTKNHKYSGWILATDAYYYLQNSKQLKHVVAPLEQMYKRLQNSDQSASTKTKLNRAAIKKAQRAASHLKNGATKKFVQASLKKLANGSDVENVTTNMFIWGLVFKEYPSK